MAEKRKVVEFVKDLGGKTTIVELTQFNKQEILNNVFEEVKGNKIFNVLIEGAKRGNPDWNDFRYVDKLGATAQYSYMLGYMDAVDTLLVCNVS